MGFLAFLATLPVPLAFLIVLIPLRFVLWLLSGGPCSDEPDFGKVLDRSIRQGFTILLVLYALAGIGFLFIVSQF